MNELFDIRCHKINISQKERKKIKNQNENLGYFSFDYYTGYTAIFSQLHPTSTCWFVSSCRSNLPQRREATKNCEKTTNKKDKRSDPSKLLQKLLIIYFFCMNRNKWKYLNYYSISQKNFFFITTFSWQHTY